MLKKQLFSLQGEEDGKGESREIKIATLKTRGGKNERK